MNVGSYLYSCVKKTKSLRIQSCSEVEARGRPEPVPVYTSGDSSSVESLPPRSLPQWRVFLSGESSSVESLPQ